MTFFYKTLPRRKFYEKFALFKALKIWRCHFVDEKHILIKLASDRTILNLESPEPTIRHRLPSQIAFFVLFDFESGEIVSLSENASANLCDVMINFQHFIEFSSQPENPKVFSKHLALRK